MKRFWVILLSLTFIASGLATAATGKIPAEFRGVQWGSAPSKLIKRSSGPVGQDKLEIWVPVNKRLGQFLGIPVAEEMFLFTNGKLYSGKLVIDTQDNFVKIKNELSKLYGKPDFINDSIKSYKWIWPSEKIQVSLYYEAKFQQAIVTFKTDKIK